jgi:hypothetical protein
MQCLSLLQCSSGCTNTPQCYVCTYIAFFNGTTASRTPPPPIIETLPSLPDTPQSVVVVWTSDHADLETSTWQQMTLIRDGHPFTSKPLSQQASGRILNPYAARPLVLAVDSVSFVNAVVSWIPLLRIRLVLGLNLCLGIHRVIVVASGVLLLLQTCVMICYDIVYDTIYGMIYYVWYDTVWLWYMMYLLTALGWTPGGSSTVRIYTQHTEQHNDTEYTEYYIHNDKNT